MCCIKGQLIIGAFLTLGLKLPVICKLYSVTKDEVMDSPASNCPSSFGSVVVAIHCSLNSLDARLDKSSGLGRK